MPTTTEDLTTEFDAWTKAQGLPEVDAESLLLQDLTADQRQWVSEFILRWEGAQADEDAAPWAVGERVEYANGFVATVAHVEGEFAILERHLDLRVKKHPAFIVAQGDANDFIFPAEGEDDREDCPTLEAALAQLAVVKRFPKIAGEFYSFDLATLPAIPEGFEDESWHNDAMPSFLHPKLGLRLHIDHADPERRESPDQDRFGLYQLVDASGIEGYEDGHWDWASALGFEDEEGERVVQGDDWEEVVRAIALADKGRDLPPALHAEITDIESGKAWLRCLCTAGMEFHLEDSPDDIIEGATGEPLFKRRDIRLIRQRVAALYDLEWGPEHECPIGYILEITGD